MNEPKFRVTLTFEYEPNITLEAYGTTDPSEAAKVDQEGIADDPASFLMNFEDVDVKVEVV